MPKKITPNELAEQLHWEIDKIAEFAADVFEEANDHNVAGALRALNAMDFELACEFIKFEKDHMAAGHLTEELNDRRNELLKRLRESSGK